MNNVTNIMQGKGLLQTIQFKTRNSFSPENKNATALNTLNCDGSNSVDVGLGKGKEVQQYFDS